MDVYDLNQSQILKFSVSDEYGNVTDANLTVQIKDLAKPEISFVGADEIYLIQGQDYNMTVLLQDYATVTDNYDGNLSSQINLVGLEDVNLSVVSDYSVYFVVSDSSGNEANKTLTVQVQDPCLLYTSDAADE